MAISGVIDRAAMKAGMHRETARRCLRAGEGPSRLNKPHTWRTQEDPVKAIWAEAERRLKAQPALEAQTLFEDLLAKHSGIVSSRARRTFRRPLARSARAGAGSDRGEKFMIATAAAASPCRGRPSSRSASAGSP